MPIQNSISEAFAPFMIFVVSDTLFVYLGSFCLKISGWVMQKFLQFFRDCIRRIARRNKMVVKRINNFTDLRNALISAMPAGVVLTPTKVNNVVRQVIAPVINIFIN